MKDKGLGSNGIGSLIFHTLFMIFIIAPLAVIILVSFSDKGYISMPFDGVSLRWYRAILDAPELMNALWISIWIGLGAATVASLVAVPAAIAIARYRFAGRDALMALLLSPLMIPHVVLGVAFLRFFSLMGWSGSFMALLLVHALIVVPFSLRLTLGAIIGLSRDAELAARSLGASRWIAFRRILLPLILPGVAGGWVLSFIQSFDEVTMTVFIATPGMTTLPVALYHRVSMLTDPVTTSVSAIMIVGTMVMMFILDRLVGIDRVLIGKK
ncbi:putative spermidine/putrescine transport system permease protein [Paracoccus alcaliphilus]|uniref:Putative spermidine/putrescine transport system permease protein n=1 Tax=Paracoccus alcaliphilus TaxID=34002 RepID=A0A1H8P0Q1_9RHOB|nr:ABC transporter permease [Paracoccus alcaliphilus]WCR19722.1 ABC transporter permease [Paracoccus alcaliphilus]SEO35496.1 putative spermidine/putrescine transport system permease protein [Paracoccus alcaliphilus]